MRETNGREPIVREPNAREPNAREPNVAVEEPPRHPVSVRRNSVQRNFEPRGRGRQQDQYDPYNARNVPSPPPRFQQLPPPPRRRADNNRNMDRGRANDYRPDYGRNQQTDYARQNDFQAGRNEFNGRNQQNDYGRQQEGGYNNYRGTDNRNNYNPRYNNPMDEGRNSYNPRYNDPIDEGRNSYAPRYNDASSYAPRYNDIKEEGRSPYPRYNDIKEESRSYVPRYNDPVRSPTRNYTTAAPAQTPAAPLIPSRQGNEVPTVQIVAWDNVAYGFTDYVERVFSTNQIRASSITLPYSKNSREEIVKQMILEGVKAIVMIDRHNEAQTKVYLQAFAPAEHGQGVRYDGNLQTYQDTAKNAKTLTFFFFFL